ncbi:MAG: phosphoribosylglycinamide formyltransferase [Flavobacteriales bacterium]
MKIAVFVSGNGSNLQVIIDSIERRILKQVKIQFVIADRVCHGIERAKKHQIHSHQFLRKDKALFQQIDGLLDSEVDLIVLAGFLSIIPTTFCQKWKNKIINLHPSLLPKYGGVGMYGDRVHRAVLDHNEKESGATVHFVTGEVDQGEIILQKSCEVDEGETVESLKKKIQKIEHIIIVEAINVLAKNRTMNKHLKA